MRVTEAPLPVESEFRKQFVVLRRYEKDLPERSTVRRRWNDFVPTVDGSQSTGIPECGFLWPAGFATFGAGVLVAPRWVVSVRHLVNFPAPYLVSLPLDSGLDIAPGNSFFISEIVPEPKGADLVLARLNRAPLLEDSTLLSVISDIEFLTLTEVRLTSFGPDPNGEQRPFKKQTPPCPIGPPALLPPAFPPDQYFIAKNSDPGQPLVVGTDSGGAVTAQVNGSTRLAGLIVASLGSNMAICLRLSAFAEWLAITMAH